MKRLLAQVWSYRCILTERLVLYQHTGNFLSICLRHCEALLLARNGLEPCYVEQIVTKSKWNINCGCQAWTCTAAIVGGDEYAIQIHRMSNWGTVFKAYFHSLTNLFWTQTKPSQILQNAGFRCVRFEVYGCHFDKCFFILSKNELPFIVPDWLCDLLNFLLFF